MSWWPVWEICPLSCGSNNALCVRTFRWLMVKLFHLLELMPFWSVGTWDIDSSGWRLPHQLPSAIAIFRDHLSWGEPLYSPLSTPPAPGRGIHPWDSPQVQKGVHGGQAQCSSLHLPGPAPSLLPPLATAAATTSAAHKLFYTRTSFVGEPGVRQLVGWADKVDHCRYQKSPSHIGWGQYRASMTISQNVGSS